jgi:hypothetical protein
VESRGAATRRARRTGRGRRVERRPAFLALDAVRHVARHAPKATTPLHATSHARHNLGHPTGPHLIAPPSSDRQCPAGCPDGDPRGLPPFWRKFPRRGLRTPRSARPRTAPGYRFGHPRPPRPRLSRATGAPFGPPHAFRWHACGHTQGRTPRRS